MAIVVRMRRVLIVDDNPDFAENMAEIVNDAGIAEAAVAASGAQALELLAAQRFDALVTDMRMPGMSGAQLVAHARRSDPGLPVVIVTAFTGDDDLAAAARHGVLSVLPKPLPVARLLELVARARRGGLVFLVEDDRALADNVAEALRGSGFTTALAHSLGGLETLGGEPCAALVDLRLPGGSDGAAVAWLRERFPSLPLVVVTGYPEAVALPSTVRVLEKPFATAELLATVEQLFAQRQA
jgi:CheY-like chemotaxis protein